VNGQIHFVRVFYNQNDGMSAEGEQLRREVNKGAVRSDARGVMDAMQQINGGN
jgi:hypothetical protein